MTAFPVAFLLGLVITAVLAPFAPISRPQTPHTAPKAPRLRVTSALWLGLVVTTALVSAFQGHLPAPDGMRLGPRLGWLIVASLPLALTTIISDNREAKSERHATGLLLSAVGLVLVGFAIPWLSSPIQGTVFFGPFWTLFFTVLWLFLLASIVELVSLIPYGAPLLGMALALVIWHSGGTQQTVASFGLAGVIAGCVMGRVLAGFMLGNQLIFGKTEVFALGLWLTALTNISFLKSVALTGFVLPLGALAVGVIILGLQAFERSLIMRAAPRADET